MSLKLSALSPRHPKRAMLTLYANDSPQLDDGTDGAAASSGERCDCPSPGGAPCLLQGRREVVIDGLRYALVPVELAACPSARPVESPEGDAMQSVLTAREIQIVQLVASGMVNKQIAGTLQISEWTVSTHLRRIFSKLGVDTRAAMVSRYMNGRA